MMVDILFASHKIIDSALAAAVDRLITARILQEGLARHIQEKGAAVLHDGVYHLLNRQRKIETFTFEDGEFIVLAVIAAFHIRDKLVGEIRGDVLGCRHIVERFHRRHKIRPAKNREFFWDGFRAAAARAHIPQILALRLQSLLHRRFGDNKRIDERLQLRENITLLLERFQRIPWLDTRLYFIRNTRNIHHPRCITLAIQGIP